MTQERDAVSVVLLEAEIGKSDYDIIKDALDAMYSIKFDEDSQEARLLSVNSLMSQEDRSKLKKFVSKVELNEKPN